MVLPSNLVRRMKPTDKPEGHFTEVCLAPPFTPPATKPGNVILFNGSPEK